MRSILRVLLVSAFAVAVSAQTPKPTAIQGQLAERFKRADTNGDGRIDDAEARAAGLWFQDDFSSVDTDRSGTVTILELGQALQERLADWMAGFDAADTNHDGELSQDEIDHAPNFLKTLLASGRAQPANLTRSEVESRALDQIYRQSSLPAVAPNIIEKRF